MLLALEVVSDCKAREFLTRAGSDVESMTCTNPFELEVDGDMKIVPCGHCRACRIRRSAEWTVRLWHESLCHEDSVFVTLTYDDEHMPEDCMLKKDDLQKYVKRLRTASDKKIKYYAVGEYGDKTGRPHYHGIFFGLGIREHGYKRFSGGRKGNDTLVGQNGVAVRSWQSQGNVILGTVTMDSMRYVCDYVQKKLYKPRGEETGRVEPFSLMSKGLGKEFALKNGAQIADNKYVMVNGIKHGVPRYYAKVLDIEKELGVFDKDKKILGYEKYWRSNEQRDRILKARESLRGDKG